MAEITEEGADDSIDGLAGKCLNVDRYPNRRPGEVRVIFRISPECINTMG